ncbi:NB-ARC domain-containing protein, partial [Scytonema sp. PRP1]|uniref:NB-ARC domain-containing protein n=1 Tax=Scytonema sp. PRP1 TaxID=3120513 RepID=UPI00300CEB6E
MTLGVFRQLAKKIWRMFSRLFRIVWKKCRKRRTIPHFPTTERYSSSLDVPTQATSEPKPTSERSPKIDQTSTGNQNQNIGSISDNSIVFGDVGRDVYVGYNKRPATGAPFQMPSLPQYFVERPEHHKQIKTCLLSLEGNRTGILVVSAIYGLAGIGKSTLAAAVAHDPEVQAQFPDGVLWVTLGQQPNLLALLSNWIQSLKDYDYKPLTPEDASKHLQTLLYDKKALLVVDDAWNPEHVEPFRVGGSSCRVLVTTREATIRGAISYDLDVMTPNESLELLQKSQNNPLTGAEKQQAQQLAQTVGYLPLALDLAAAQVADGVSWQELLEDLNLEIARLESLQTPGADSCTHEEQRKRYSLIASFNLSLRSLIPEMLQQFAWFGVLPEDVVITHTMAATLWEISPKEALTTLRSFKTKALLLAGSTGDDQKQTYRLHDLMHEMTKRLLTTNSQVDDLPGLSLTPPAAHALFLERYQVKTKNSLWHTLQDDGYIHAHLTWHLEQAKQVNELHQLLREETESGHNGWYEACARLGQTGSYLTDISRAWKLVEDFWSKAALPQVIGLQCRYALIRASLNSLAAKILPENLLVALVKKNVWTPEQGLAYALQTPDLKQRVNLLVALVDDLPQNLKEQAQRKALTGVRAIQDEWSRANALGALANKLLPELIPGALRVAQAIQNERDRANALSTLADKLPTELMPEALAAARAIQDEGYRANTLSALADKLPTELMPEALAAARAIQGKRNRANALKALANKEPLVLPEALVAVRAIQDENYRANALSALADKLPTELMPEALAAARTIQNERNRANALKALANKEPSVLPEALVAVRAIQDESSRADALGALANKLLPELIPGALKVAQAIQDENYRANALGALADKLPTELMPEALAAARAIQDEGARANALKALANKEPSVLPEALAAARAIQDEGARANALRALAGKLPSVLPEALAAARAIQDEGYRANALRALADKLPSVLPEALAAARAIQDEWSRVNALGALAGKLPTELMPEALAAAQAIQDEGDRAHALKALADKLPSVLPEALAAVRTIQNERERTDALNVLADKLPTELMPEAL